MVKGNNGLLKSNWKLSDNISNEIVPELFK